MQTDTRYTKIFQPLLAMLTQDRRRADMMATKGAGYGEAILRIRDQIKEMHRLSLKVSKTREGEIFYFREIWPFVFGQWFYYHKASEFLLKGSLLSEERIEVLARVEQREAARFFRENWAFWVDYVGRTPNINEQFLRSYSQNCLYDPMSMVIDPDGATVASYKAAWGLALTDYGQLVKRRGVTDIAAEPLTDFAWGCSDADAVELLYSLHASKAILFRGQQADIAHLGTWFKENFHKEIVSIYDRFKAVRNRKKDRAPFMRRLLAGLEKKMDQAEGKFE